MSYVQIITPDPTVDCIPGECLVYVEDAYHVHPTGKYPRAIDNWNASQFKHQNYLFPVSCWVPVWFTMRGVPAGHVALRAPDGSIWSSSSPTSTKAVHHSSLEALESYYGGRLTYLGWTEDVEDTLVIKGEEFVNDKARVKAVFNNYLGQEPTDKDYAYWVGRPWWELDDSAVTTLKQRHADELAKEASVLPKGKYIVK